jgi:hypothetical protein
MLKLSQITMFQRQEIRAISNEQQKGKNPNKIHTIPRNPISFQLTKWSLISPILKNHKHQRINIIDGLELRIVNSNSMKKANRVNPPRHISIYYQRR